MYIDTFLGYPNPLGHRVRLAGFLLLSAITFNTAAGITAMDTIDLPGYEDKDITCDYQSDHLPTIDPIADEFFQEARQLEKFRGKIDHDKITALYEEAAALNHWKAMHNLAMRYRRGKGSIVHPGKTIDLVQKLVDMNIPIGYYDMAVMLEKGFGIKKDRESAWQYLHKAAQLGNPDAGIRLGKHYAYDLPYEKQQDKEAAAYFYCAAKQNDPRGLYYYGRFLRQASELYPESMYYSLLAAGEGLDIAAAFLGGVFYSGDYGYKKDEELYDKYENLAIQLSNNEKLRFPSIVKDYPLPPHPEQGYGVVPQLEAARQARLKELADKVKNK